VAAPASKVSNYVTYFCYTTIFGVWLGSQLTLIPYVLHLLVLVTAISLRRLSFISLILLEETSEEDKANGVTSQTETLRKEDAYQFPRLGSYRSFRSTLPSSFSDKDWVNFLIGFYFCAVGCVALFATLSS
jgi:fatty acid desaturase